MCLLCEYPGLSLSYVTLKMELVSFSFLKYVNLCVISLPSMLCHYLESYVKLNYRAFKYLYIYISLKAQSVQEQVKNIQ